MTDFPRGWTLSVDQAGGVASILIPAIAGVAHVLDAVTAKLVNATAGVAGHDVVLTSSDGAFAGMVLIRLGTPIPAAGSVEFDSGGASELGLAAGPGASLTIAFTPGGAGFTQTLLVQGHDI